MQTRTARITTLLCLLLLLTACATGTPKRNIKTEPASAVTTIRFAYPKDFSAWFDPLIKGFLDAHPEYQIEAVDLPESEDASAPFIRDGKADLMLFNALPFHLFPNQVLGLDPYIRKSNMSLDHYKLEQSEFLLDGRVFALPVIAFPRVLVGNADLFQRAGVPLPDDTWTWDEFREAARRLTSADRTDMSTPPIPSDRKDGPINRSTTPVSYQSGKAAMAMSAAGMEGRVPFRQVILPLPTMPGSKPVHYVWYWSLAIPATSDEPDGAWAFVEFATGPNGGLTLANQRLLPMYLTPEIEKAWVATQLPGAQAVMQSRWMDHFPNPPLGGHIRETMDQAIIRALSGAAPVEQVAADYADWISVMPKK